MPHLHIEASPALASALDWPQLSRQIHQALAGQGWARLEDLKTRVLPCSYTQAALDPQGEQLVATLITTNPRPPEVLRAMSDCVLSHLQQAVQALGPAHWVQCCVFTQATERSDYAKWHWLPPTPTSTSTH